MANLTFLKDAQIYRIDVNPLAGTFVVGEFFTDDVDSTKLGEVIAFTDDLDSTGTIDYVLVGSNATQFVATNTFTGDGGGTGTVNSSPADVGTHDVHVIQVDSPFTVVTIQDLINQIREYEDELIQLDHPKMIDASGKQDLGGGVLVGITLELLDNWRVQFEPRSGPLIVPVSIAGGNIVTTNDFNDNTVKPSPFTQVTITSSSSATIAQLEIIDLVHRIESLRDSHSAFGKIIYWNPTLGDDEFLGSSPDTAVATFSRAHDIATSGDGDVIFALNKGAAGNVLVNEQLSITKNSLSLRGPGTNFRISNTSGTGPSITITGNNVVVEHIAVEHDVGATSMTDGILIDGSGGNVNNILIKDILFLDNKADSISINDSVNSVIQGCFIEDSGGNGITVGDNVDDLFITDNTIDRPVYGVNLTGSALDTILINNDIHDCSQYGIRVGPTADQTIIRASNYLFDNIVGDILEEVGSTNTNIESLTTDQQLFNGTVTLDQTAGTSGTEFPIGTQTNPVDNLTDALQIAANNSLEDIFVREGTFVVTTALDFDKFHLTGDGPSRSRLIFSAGAYTTDKTIFERMFVAGPMIGDSVLMRDCAVGSGDMASLAVTDFQGSFNRCAIVGDVTARVNTGGENSVAFIDCYTAGNQIPTVDLNGDKALTIVNYSGNLKIDGITGTSGAQLLRIGMLHGDMELLSGNTGTNAIVVEGVGNLLDNSSLTVNDDNLMSKIIQDNNDDPNIFV
jgi:hypothetical protein